jgi:hypothetical protein
MQLAFLAPDLIEGIIANRLAAAKGVVDLTAVDIPLQPVFSAGFCIADRNWVQTSRQ